MLVRARSIVALGPRLAASLVLLVALLVAPLRLAVAETTDCCCPRPAECRCPDHQPGEEGTTIRRCSQPVERAAPIPAPTLVALKPIVLVRPALRAVAIVTMLPAPHPSPDLARARGPS